MSKADQRNVKNQTQGNIAQNNQNQATAGVQLNSVLDTARTSAANILPGVTAGYSNISETGGYDPSILGKVNSTYGDLADTGGVSASQETAMQNRAAEAARSTYQTGQDAFTRQIAATGGYGAGSGVSAEALARRGSQAAATAVEDTNASITGLKQQGRIAGASGLSDTQNKVASNKLAALSGSTNIYGMNENQVSTTVDQILRNYQQTGQLNNQDLSILTNLANQPGVFDKIVSTIGTLGGATAGVIGAVKG
jgi:hypothetical protein